MPPDLTPEERQSRTEATERLLDRMRAGTGDGTEWWDHPYEELGNRSPTDAILAGNEDQVLRLIAAWYEATDSAAKRLGSDPSIVTMIQERGESLRRSA